MSRNRSPQNSQPERRSKRIQGQLEGRAQQQIIDAAKALTEEELAADREMNALYRKGKTKIDHDAFFRAADMAARLEQGDNASGTRSALDLSFLDGEDRDAIADCTGTQDDPADAAKRHQRIVDLGQSIFWKSEPWAESREGCGASIPPLPSEWFETGLADEGVYDVLLSGAVRDLAQDNGCAFRWLCDVSIASAQDHITMRASADVVNALGGWDSDPFRGSGSSFSDFATNAWDELGATEDTGAPLTVGQSRETTTAVVCQIARALASANVLPDQCAVGLVRKLAVLAMDPTTSPALRSEISDTVGDLVTMIEPSDSWPALLSSLTDDLAGMPLVVQARTICMFGQGSESIRTLARWTALSLLLRSSGQEGDFSQRYERHPNMADLHSGMDLILSGLREAEPNYYRLLDQLSLWSSAAGDTYVLVQRWWEEKLRCSEELAEAEQAEESLGLGLSLSPDVRVPETPVDSSRATSVSLHDESRASSALVKVKSERPSPGLENSENEKPLSLFLALKYAANKVRDEPGTSPLLKSRLNQLAQCIQQNVMAEVKLLEAAKAAEIYKRGYLEEGTGGQTRLSFGGAGVKIERDEA